MASKINHVAIMSANYTLEYKFYETYFGMKNSAKARSTGSAAIGWLRKECRSLGGGTVV